MSQPTQHPSGGQPQPQQAPQRSAAPVYYYAITIVSTSEPKKVKSILSKYMIPLTPTRYITLVPEHYQQALQDLAALAKTDHKLAFIPERAATLNTYIEPVIITATKKYLEEAERDEENYQRLIIVSQNLLQLAKTTGDRDTAQLAQLIAALAASMAATIAKPKLIKKLNKMINKLTTLKTIKNLA